MRIAISIIALAALAAPASAAGPNINPGKWQFDTSIMMMGQPQKQSETKCITKEEAEADPLATIIEEGRCKVLSQTETGDSLEFEVECKGDPKMPMKMRGKGKFTGNGDTASGSMDVNVEMPEMPNMPQMQGNMTMKQTWEGKRLGACD